MALAASASCAGTGRAGVGPSLGAAPGISGPRYWGRLAVCVERWHCVAGSGGTRGELAIPEVAILSGPSGAILAEPIALANRIELILVEIAARIAHWRQRTRAIRARRCLPCCLSHVEGSLKRVRPRILRIGSEARPMFGPSIPASFLLSARENQPSSCLNLSATRPSAERGPSYVALAWVCCWI
jgi:hypothetical protein